MSIMNPKALFAGQSLDSMDLKTAGCIELAELQSALKKSLGDMMRLCGETEK